MAYKLGAALVCLWTRFQEAMKDDQGMATIEIVLVISILIALALMFKDVIVDFVDGILDSIAGQGSVFDPASIAP